VKFLISLIYGRKVDRGLRKCVSRQVALGIILTLQSIIIINAIDWTCFFFSCIAFDIFEIDKLLRTLAILKCGLGLSLNSVWLFGIFNVKCALSEEDE